MSKRAGNTQAAHLNRPYRPSLTNQSGGTLLGDLPSTPRLGSASAVVRHLVLGPELAFRLPFHAP